MVIVSQDKTEFVNFNNVTSIFCEQSKIKCVFLIDKSVTLGEYETEERAKDILKKMINAIGLDMYMYQMPKK